MKRLIMIRGNSGSGKTIVAKGLQQKFGSNTMVISQDVIRREILKVSDGMNTLALPLLKELLKYGYEHCEIVILEGILKKDWYKPLFEYAKELYKDEIYAYYYEIPFEETVQRHKTKPNCNDFGAEEMKDWWNEKDYIGYIYEKPIYKESKREETINNIYNEVSNME